MMSMAVETRWQAFLEAYFREPNSLRPDTGIGELDEMIGMAHAAWTHSPAGVLFLPALLAGETNYYAVCPDADQRLWTRDLIRAFVGSWVSFDGEPLPRDTDDPIDRAALQLLEGTDGYVFRFSVPSAARKEAREGVRTLAKALASRPYRRVQLARPLGRLIGDFWDACASGAESEASNLLELLSRDHRLSRINRLFLRVQYLAVFERWDLLENLDEFGDLLRLDRPVLASDSLARLALARLSSPGSVADFDSVKAKYGALIPSVTAIRSPAGAQYYAMWSLSAAEPPEDVARRLSEAGWLDKAVSHPALAAILAKPSAPNVREVAELDQARLDSAMVEGRLDAAVELLASTIPDSTYLPVLVHLVRQTLSPMALQMLQRWRESLGDPAIDEALADRTWAPGGEVPMPDLQLADVIERAFADDGAAGDRLRWLAQARKIAVSGLMEPGGLHGVVTVVRSLGMSMRSELIGDLVELLLDMERNLFAAAGNPNGMQDMRMLTLEVWALSDETGDRTRATRVVDLVGRMLDAGVSAATFVEVVELLRAAWVPLLTDADVPLGLDVIEMLAATKPDVSVALQTFVTPVLTRIGQHNARRIGRDALDVAADLAAEFGLELTHELLPSGALEDVSEVDRASIPAGTYVAIYSLLDPAARRAALIIRRRHPQVRVESFSDKVATDGLRVAARTADVLVVADRAASHAATDALRTARESRPIGFARGKGSTSLIEAVELGLSDLVQSVVGRP